MKSILIRKAKLYQEKERLKSLKFDPNLSDEEENRVREEELKIRKQLEFYREILRRINDKDQQNIRR